MKQYISEEQAIYLDAYHGNFSRKLAQWAIKNMKMKDSATEKEKSITIRSVDDVMEILRANGVDIPDEYIYMAWYLYHMAIADYPKALSTDKQRSLFVEETILDPDGEPSNVLACFEAKMCNAGIPIYWERMM